MKDIAFQPGLFQPVVEVSQRQTGVPAPAETDFVGLEEVTKTTLQVSLASARGSGAVVPDVVPVSSLSRVIGHVLACRNIVEQLLFIGVYSRVSNPLRNAKLEILEPLVRAYNYYGHFERDQKLYVTRGLEHLLVWHLFRLRLYATSEVAAGTKDTIMAVLPITDIDLDFYFLNQSGDIAFGKRFPLKEYVLRLVKYVSTTYDGVSLDRKLPILRQILDITTEDGLNAFLRYARTLPSFEVPDREFVSTPTDKHKAAMKKLFGKEYSSDNEVIPIAKFVESINYAYQTARRVTLERAYGMKTMSFPKYEGGSAAQLSAYIDDVLVSEVPLSLSESTAALAFSTSYGALQRYRSAPGLERDELLRELVSQSLIRV